MAAHTLPAPIARLFWEYDRGVVSWPAHADLVIERLLTRGGLDSWRWLRARCSDDELSAWLVRRGHRILTPRQLRFWGLVLGIEPALVTSWIEARRGAVWLRRRNGPEG